MECAPSKAARSAALKPLSAKFWMLAAAAPLQLGSVPCGAGLELSLRPTNVCTRGPPGQLTMAVAPAICSMSATVTGVEAVLYFCWRARSLTEILCRPLFSGRLYSWARIREPSQPPVEPWVFSQVPQSWNAAYIICQWEIEEKSGKPIHTRRAARASSVHCLVEGSTNIAVNSGTILDHTAGHWFPAPPMRAFKASS